MATATATKNGRPKRAKQQHLPGMKPPSIPKIDQAAETYHEAKLERQAKSKAEGDAKKNLIFEMVEAGLERYKTPDGLVVTVTGTKNVATKRDGEESGQDDAESEE